MKVSEEGPYPFAVIAFFSDLPFGFTYFYFIRIFLFFLMDFSSIFFSSPGGLSAIASSFVARWRNYH